ncbi:HNH endonuclease [Candidatus Dojkabacteria bacterium]|jgi:5-methylcytosine-specific restriction protein A|nr:HNH endonuclease [Candidatus Dojkabacteria bacterium]
MLFTENNLKNFRITKNNNFINPATGKYFYYHYACNECGYPFIGHKNGKYCSHKHAIISEEYKSNMSMLFAGKNNPMFDKIFTKEHRAKIGIAKSKGDVTVKNIPLYDTYASQLELYEQCRRNADDPNILEVKCTYCGKWYIPTRIDIRNRIFGINSNDIHKLYCSDHCKSVCSLFNQSAQQLIMRDKIAAGHILPNELNREVQPQLRQMSFARDDYICVKCGSTGPLHCHHIDPVKLNPIESADVDNCITLCIDCHKEAHQLPGCKYNELKRCG